MAAMPAVRAALAIAREETAILTSEAAVVGRTALAEISTAGKVALEMNPLAVREAAQIAARDTTAESSILTQHLSLAPKSSNLSSSSLLSGTIRSNTLSGSSTVTQAIEQDMGSTLKEVILNAGQTGVEEQMDKAVEVAKILGGEEIVGEVTSEVLEAVQVMKPV